MGYVLHVSGTVPSKIVNDLSTSPAGVSLLIHKHRNSALPMQQTLQMRYPPTADNVLHPQQSQALPSSLLPSAALRGLRQLWPAYTAGPRYSLEWNAPAAPDHSHRASVSPYPCHVSFTRGPVRKSNLCRRSWLRTSRCPSKGGWARHRGTPTQKPVTETELAMLRSSNTSSPAAAACQRLPPDMHEVRTQLHRSGCSVASGVAPGSRATS